MSETIITKSQQKRMTFEKFLEQGDAYLILDPRKDGVVAPPNLCKQSSLMLLFGYSLVIPIRDLQITDERVTATLSFDRSPFWCSIPWDAVFGVKGDGEVGIGWPDDFPKDALTSADNSQELKKQSHLRVVKSR